MSNSNSNSNSNSVFEDWDDKFLVEAIDVLERATSSSSYPPTHPIISYSPPRHLTQSLINNNNNNNNNNNGFYPPFSSPNQNFTPPSQKLQRGSGRTVKQLTSREQGSQLFRKTDKKKEPPQSILSQITERDTDVQHRYPNNLEYQAHAEDPREQNSGFQSGLIVNNQDQGGQHAQKAGTNKEPPKSTFSQVPLKDADVQQRYPQNLEPQAHAEYPPELPSGFQSGLSVNNQEQGGQHARKVDQKTEPPKFTFSQIALKDADAQHRYPQNLEPQGHTEDLPELTSGFQNGSYVYDHMSSRITLVPQTCKSIGVQTEKYEIHVPSSVNNMSISRHQRSKLLDIWGSPTRQGSQKNLVSELLVACETELGILFGFLNKSTKKSQVDGKLSGQSLEAEKVYNLYSMLTKIGSTIMELDAVLEALIDLCSLDNDVILYRSLRVLHKTLNHLYVLDVRSNNRDNVLVEGASSGNNTTETSGFLFAEFCDSSFPAFRKGLSGSENKYKKEPTTHRYASSVSYVDWVSVFELMRQIATRDSEECIRLEAVSIMNMILIRSNAYIDRERFGRVLGFRFISQFMRKDSGTSVQKEAVHLLRLLLNCPQLMVTFCSGCKGEVENDVNMTCEAESNSTVEECSAILEGLGGCIACGRSSILELKLRRDTVTLLAFLASSGKVGFEILLTQTLLKGSNYFVLMLQMLVSEIDAEVSNIYELEEVFIERTLLIRETLIFFNRLVSNPQFSIPVLRALTNSRGTACLAVDVAMKLSSKTKWSWQSDSMVRQMRESEIVDLARVFKKRVFQYIDNGSP